MTDKNKKYKAPRVGDRTGYIPTKAVMADTYDERILEEMEETLTATVYSEIFPNDIDYENLGRAQGGIDIDYEEE